MDCLSRLRREAQEVEGCGFRDALATSVCPQRGKGESAHWDNPDVLCSATLCASDYMLGSVELGAPHQQYYPAGLEREGVDQSAGIRDGNA